MSAAAVRVAVRTPAALSATMREMDMGLVLFGDSLAAVVA